METNEEMTQENKCDTNSSGSGGDCCSSGSGNWKSWRTVVFIIVLLAAGALAAHSVLSKGTNSLCGGIAAGLCPLNKSCSSSNGCELKAAGTENAACIIKEKANKPSSCCPNAEVPSYCPNAGTSDCCANTETPSGCPITENQGGCPKTTAASGCCPNAGSE